MWKHLVKVSIKYTSLFTHSLKTLSKINISTNTTLVYHLWLIFDNIYFILNNSMDKKYIRFSVWDDINYPFANFKGRKIEVENG